MGGWRSFQVESKSFDVTVGVGLCLTEWGWNHTNTISSDREGAQWLKKVLREVNSMDLDQHYIRTRREANKVFWFKNIGMNETGFW